MKNKEVKLYNILFPLWLVIIFPVSWLVIVPGNFIIDSLVLLIAMSAMKIAHRKEMYKKTILKVWLFGFISDFIGAGFLFIAFYVLELPGQGDDLYLTAPATLLAAICIFIFNYLISFKDYDRKTRFKMALTFALFTAPYTFLVPMAWIYG